MMIRGRHRGLPLSIDRAITLPSDRLADTDEEERDGGRYVDGGKTSGLESGNGNGKLSERMGRKMEKSWTQ